MIERAAEGDPQRLARSSRAGPPASQPAGSTCRRSSLADLIAPLGRCPQRASRRVAEPRVDDQPERLARAQRVAGLAVRRQAALDAGGVEQDGEPPTDRVPQLVLGGQQRADDHRWPPSSSEPDVPGGVALAHRRREPHVEPEQVARHLGRRRADAEHLGRGRPLRPGPDQDGRARPRRRVDRVAGAVDEGEAGHEAQVVTVADQPPGHRRADCPPRRPPPGRTRTSAPPGSPSAGCSRSSPTARPGHGRGHGAAGYSDAVFSERRCWRPRRRSGGPARGCRSRLARRGMPCRSSVSRGTPTGSSAR